MLSTVVPKIRANWRKHALAGVAAAFLLGDAPSHAQTGPTSGNPSLLGLATGPQAPQGRMMVEADSLVYDINNERISAVGGVVIYYGSYTLVAERVDVDRTRKRVTATGSVEIADAAGNIVRGAKIDLTDDLRDGVVEAFELVTEQRIAFTATRATRSNGDVTEFEDSTYLPCVDCDGVPGRNPIWRIKAKRIVHKQGERTITFQDATFEFLGVPLAWVPVLSQPDPTVRRKSGFLTPRPSYNEALGFGLSTPYFYALAPNMDLTVAPGFYTRQGAFMDVEWRHRLIDGAYSIRIAGLRQNNPDVFSGISGDRLWRGSVASKGDFRINERWSWGWDLAAATDRSFFDNYDRPEGKDDIVNDIFLTGVDGRNRFDAHLYGFFVQQEDSLSPRAPDQGLNLQDKQPFVHPVVDYQVYAPEPIAGGELSVKTNVTSLTRSENDIFEFDGDGDGRYGDEDPDGEPTRLRGAAGSFTRASVDAVWRRRFTDSIGQVFTPFTYFRGDLLFSAPDQPAAVGLENNEFAARGMPAVGLEYSYPVLVDSPLGSNVIEPVAQLIVRPNEAETGNFPNEDAQSLVFEATNLFNYDKFSGYDRVEGGTRLNVGVRYTGQFVNNISLTGVAGRSLHLFGENSFATTTPYDTGKESGLDHDASDYVAALSLNTNRGLLVNGASRFDHVDFTLNRMEAQLVGSLGPLTSSFTYAYIRQQPDLGLRDDRKELQAAANLRLAEHWRLFGSTRYDIENENFVRNALGLAYDDEAFSISVSYSEDTTRATGELTDRTVYLRLGFRTLGDTSTSIDALR